MFGLDRIDDYVNAAIANNFPKCCGVLVVHKGETVYEKYFGEQNKGVPLNKKSLFRLFSLTKPVTAAAVMKLLEDGKLELRYPLKWFINEFSEPMVLENDKLRPASRDITIADLLTMQSGIPYPDGSPVGMKMGEIWGRQTELLAAGKGIPTVEFAREMGKLPLCFDPGAKWAYGASADVLGAVVEVVSGMKFGDYLKKYIFEPLGMYDTGFFVPADKWDRLVTCHNFNNETGENEEYTVNDLCIADRDVYPAFESGGAGLYSTLSDYTKFAKMLLGEGTADGVRILGRKTVGLMREVMVGQDKLALAGWDSLLGHGYGALMRVLTDRAAAGIIGSNGQFGWDGWLGCYLSVDPSEENALVMFINQTNSGCIDFTRKLENIVRSSIE